MRPIAYSKAYLIHIVTSFSCIIAGIIHLVVSGGLELPTASLSPGAHSSFAAMFFAFLGSLHFVYLNKRGYLGLSRVKYSELEGTHIEPQIRPSSEEVQLEITEPASDEKKQRKSKKEVEGLRERLESEISARKSLLSDNQLLARQIEEREKSIRELEQKVLRSQNNVQVTAALSLAKQKEEEIGKLLNRIHDLDEKCLHSGKLVEDLREKMTENDRKNELLSTEIDCLRDKLTEMAEVSKEKDGKEAGNDGLICEIARLKEELLNAKENLRDKEREAQMIVRSAKERESEEINTLTNDLKALKSQLLQSESLSDHISSLESQLALAKSEIEAFKGKFETANHEKSAISLSISTVQTANAQKSAEILDLTSLLSAKNDEIATISAKLAEITKQKAESASNLLAILSENEDFKRSNEELSQEIERLKAVSSGA